MGIAPAILLNAVREEKKRRAAENSLIEFTRQAWDIIEPGTPFTEGWHLNVICEHLEAVAKGEIRNIIFNFPPRHMKSIAIAVMFPCWVWASRPSHRWLFASYSGSLSVRDSLKCRRLIQSTWYQERWGSKFKLIGDQNTKAFFENDQYGYRFATSVGGSTTGHGGDVIVADDPHNSLEAQSDALRETALEWWDQAMSTRLNNPATGCKVIVMQRLHERDLSGHLLKGGGYEHVCLPAEWDGVKRVTSRGNYDPRTVEGELLWPQRFDKKSLDEIKTALGDYGTAGQLQQRPSPAGGGILKIGHIKMWPADQSIPKLQYVIQSYDTAFTAKVANDPSACTVWGITSHQGKNIALLLDAWTAHLEYPELKERMIAEWNDEYGDADKEDPQSKRRKPDLLLIEEKASGQSLIQDLRLSNLPIMGYNPGRADKISRAHQIAPLLDAGFIYMPESRKKKGQFVSWAVEVIDQMEKFPADEHDDLVDTATQALIYLKDVGFLEVSVTKDEDVVQYQKPLRNPYAE